MNRKNNKQQQPMQSKQVNIESSMLMGKAKENGQKGANRMGTVKQKADASIKQPSKLIKKAYVRFDDYLDLNEENMRRSCKRLMNHLYSDSSSSSALIVAPTTSCQSSVECPNKERQIAGEPIKFVANGKSLPHHQQQHHQNQQNSSSSSSSNTSASGKSYLRSQYERRQLRQMELMQQETKCNINRNAVGANSRRHQQDLMAKSHELSKRRFFEKLQSRESMKKNLNLNQSIQVSKQQLTNQIAIGARDVEVIGNQSNDRQKNLADDALMLKVYQSIVLKDSNKSGSSNRSGSLSEQSDRDTLGGLDGSQARESASELIGFYTPSPQSSAYSHEPERLIELSSEREEEEEAAEARQREDGPLLVAPLTQQDQSAFEIKVPAAGWKSSSGSLNHADEFISSNLLVVKQVEQPVEGQQKHQHTEVEAAIGPPTSSGRCKEKASTQEPSNKTKTLLIGSTDNNKVISKSAAAEQINGQSTNNEKTMMESAPPTSNDSDNQQQAANKLAADSTISTHNNNNSNNKMETISLLKEVEETTSNVESSELHLLERSKKSATFSQQPTFEVDGESNRAKNHDAPETTNLVGQSGGAGTIAAIANDSSEAKPDSNLVYPVQKQSAAQAQQVASLQTTITKPAIRDVLPEANGINPIQAIVSSKNEAEKVIVTLKQVNEVKKQGIAQHEGFKGAGYANGMGSDANEMQILANNNVNHKVSIEAESELFSRRNIDLMGEDKHLIESFTKSSNLVKKQVSTCSTNEEDGGSSCSSSGFGASISVTSSSSEGCTSIKETTSVVISDSKREEAVYRRPSSLAIISQNQKQDYDCNHIYDSVRTQRNFVRIQSNNNEFPDCKQYVRPDQAYPDNNCARLIENHCYASVLNRCDTTQLDQSIVLQKDDLTNVGYANFNGINKAHVVEYATVKSTSNELKKKLNKSSSETSLSGQSYSTTSANSGGFSTLPPAQVDCSSVNNIESPVSLNECSQRKSSLLKRFGSLVSRAFTVATNQADSMKINESATVSEEPLETNNTVIDGTSKSALVIEKDHQVAEQVKVAEADLVILPTKHVNKRKEQPHQQAVQSQTACRHDDRLSRGKKHSRKMKQTDLTSADFSSTSSLSSLSSSTNPEHRNEYLREADSLSEELESLMSRSEHSIYYRAKNSNSTQKRALSSGKREKLKTSERIDIDCISPPKISDKVDLEVRKSGPRSLLRYLSPVSAQRAADSTPNLTSSLRNRRRKSQCDNSTYEVDDTQQPISGFWGFSSLMSPSHATKANNMSIPTSKAGRKTRTKANLKSNIERDVDDQNSMYTNLQPFAAGYRLHLSSAFSQEQQLDKCESLNLYQNLLRNYAKRRRHRHGHHHHHHHHHHHNRAHHSSSRHAHQSARCTQNFSQTCQSSSNSECSDKAVVWGQLIKINKLDGSQVIELQRSPGKSWGFFVARGAINNVKGIFISRIHDNITSHSLTGLLSIGDRILAIDDCLIEPDYDILRVNQMISKKSKILLKVKPFKG